jgi:hypothetical protein
VLIKKLVDVKLLRYSVSQRMESSRTLLKYFSFNLESSRTLLSYYRIQMFFNVPFCDVHGFFQTVYVVDMTRFGGSHVRIFPVLAVYAGFITH